MNKNKQEKIIQKIKGLCLWDDELAEKVFENNNEAIELLLRIILNKDLRVIEANVQYDIKNLKGHSIRMDIHAIDFFNKEYNIEIQRSDKGANVKRARYNSSLLDANALDKNQDYEKLKETFVIFITENDVLKGNLPIYHIERTIQENQILFDDGEHIIYVNGSFSDDSDLGKLMQDFNKNNPDDMNYKILADKIRVLKEEKEGIVEMGSVMEELIFEEKEEIAMRMLLRGKLSLEEIAEYLGLSVEQVKEFKNNMQDKIL